MKKLYLLLVGIILFLSPQISKGQVNCTNGVDFLQVQANLVSAITCDGECDGSLFATVSLGSGNYTYSWTGPSFSGNTQAITGLCEGTYDVVVTDLITGLSCSDQIILSGPNPIATSISIQNCTAYSVCNGSATLTITGGTSPYLITWYNSAQVPIAGQTGTTISNLCAGTYYYSVDDANGCNSNIGLVLVPFTITQPNPPITVIAQAWVNCAFSIHPWLVYGGLGSVVASGGVPPYTYTISNLPGSITNTTGNFSHNQNAGMNLPFTVTDAVGTVYTGSITVLPGSFINQPTVSSITPPSCPGSCDATIVINTQTSYVGYSFNMNAANPTFGPSNSATGFCAGQVVYLAASNTVGCNSFPIAVTIPNATPVGLSVSSVTHETLAGSNNGSITSNATHPQTSYYTLNGGPNDADGDFTGLAPGNYTVCAYTSTGCSQCVNTVINPGPACDANLVSPVIDQVVHETLDGLSNGQLFSHASGSNSPFTFSLDGGSSQSNGNFSNIAVGNHTICVTNSVGCTQCTNFTINAGPVCDVNLVSPIIDQILHETIDGLSNGSIQSHATGLNTPFTFVLDNSVTQSNGDFNSISAGNHTLCVTDALGCTQCTSFTIDPGVICDIQTLETIDFSANLCFGDCNGTANVDVFNSNGNYTVEWSTLQTGNSINGLCEGNYSYSVTDLVGCTANGTIVIGAPTQIQMTMEVTQTSNASSSDGIIEILSTGGTGTYQYSIDNGFTWNSGNAFSNLTANTYQVCVIDANNCMQCETVVVPAGPVCSLTASENNFPISCQGSCDGEIEIIPIGNHGPVQIEWSDLSTNFHHQNLCAGDISYEITDSVGCVFSDTLTLDEPTLLTLDTTILQPSSSTISDGQVSLSANGGQSPYLYSMDGGASFQTSPVFSDLSVGSYNFCVMEVNGCMVCVTVQLFSTNGIAEIESKLEIYPNPVSGNLTIQNSMQMERIVLINSIGQTVADFNPSSTMVQYDVSNLSVGTYQLMIFDEAGMKKTSVIVSR